MNSVVRLYCVARLLDVAKRSHRGLAVENRADLVLRQTIPLDRERPANGTDSVDAPQSQILPDSRGLGLADLLADLLGQPENGRSDRVGRGGQGRSPSDAVEPLGR